MAMDSNATLSLKQVSVHIDTKTIITDLDLEIRPGEVHALMGPNGSGKSTLVNALMGHPAYRVDGSIRLGEIELSATSPDARARAGLFLGFQYPVAVSGVSVAGFLRAAASAQAGQKVAVRPFTSKLKEHFEELGIPWEFAGRYLGDGFSGGEKKRLEILQMRMLAPRIALLDEIDSGLDIDALKVVAAGIARAASENTGILLVTHYQRILNYIRPDRVHVFKSGRIVETGGPEKAVELEKFGYDRPNEQQVSAGGY